MRPGLYGGSWKFRWYFATRPLFSTVRLAPERLPTASPLGGLGGLIECDCCLKLFCNFFDSECLKLTKFGLN